MDAYTKHQGLSLLSFLAALLTLAAASFLISGPALAQQPDLESDLLVSFRGEGGPDGPGDIVGTVTNRSERRYGCVELLFKLSKTQGDLPAIVLVQVRNLAPKAQVPYRHGLPYRTGFRLLGMRVCAARPASPPPPPTGANPAHPAPRPAPMPDQRPGPPPPPVVRHSPPTTPTVQRERCTIYGHVTGVPVRARTQLNGPLTSFRLERIGLRVGAESDTRFSTRVDEQGNYRFADLPGGTSMEVVPLGLGWRYDRSNKSVWCAGNRSFRIDIHIDGISID
jgi:hypothetical protein